MGITAEFTRLGARLVNQQWAVSALTPTEMVASLWFHRLKSEDGQLVYRDYLGRWSGHGNRLFGEHLQVALADQRPSDEHGFALMPADASAVVGQTVDDQLVLAFCFCA